MKQPQSIEQRIKEDVDRLPFGTRQALLQIAGDYISNHTINGQYVGCVHYLTAYDMLVMKEYGKQ